MYSHSKPVTDRMDTKSIEVEIQMPSNPERDIQQQQLRTTKDNNPLIVEQINDTKPKNVTDDGNQHVKFNELDKFKRRMIRAIARLMLEEKKPEAEIWEVLKKETSCDCKLLWTRMRALTIKKLKRLFDANDRNENVTKIAQLSVTDWLLFDLTLVHEDVDVIGQDVKNQNVKKDPQILEDLFQLVMKYKIEYLVGDQLTKAWNDLTKEYNSRGRKCSQMLLQRRWYQLKQLVRSKFYKFWFEYRGAERNLERAEKYKPNDLDVEIVKAFLPIVTDPFPTWQQLIDDKKVSLLNDFERLLLSKKKNSQKTANEPDILLIEPHVETIDLRVDSDEDAKDLNVKNNESLNEEHGSVDPNAADSNDSLNVVKTESICDEDEVNKLESTHIPLESNENVVPHTSDVIDVDQSNYDEEFSDHVEDKIDLIVDDDDIITQQVKGDDFEIVMPKITSITSTARILETDDGNCETTNEINNTLDKIADEVSRIKSYTVTSPTSNFEQSSIDITIEDKSEDEEIAVDPKLIQQSTLYNDVSHDLHLIDGLELEDDGIEYIDEEEHTDLKVSLEAADYISTNNDENETPKIDLKLLLNPVVYTTKLDLMDVFRFIDYTTVKDRRVIENAAVESKPVDKKSVKMDTITKESRDVPEINVIREDVSECSTENEYELVKSTSWLFRKPRGVTYNPIQLCKNPDFNTRLKRLTAGFFSSQRNRQLLKMCKPLTIDVHKAFEAKLVNNSLYLEKCFFLEAKSSEIINTVEKTVLPSELPGQSLNFNVQDSIDNQLTSKLNRITKNEFIPEVCTVERNKVINLPELDQIRRKNERLLIAEVTPLQAVNVTNPPVSIVQRNKTIEPSLLTVNDVDNNDIAKNLNNINENTTIVVTPELKNNDFSNSDTTIDTIIEETEMLRNDNRSESNNVKIGYNPNMRIGNKIKKIINHNYKLGKVSVSWNSRNAPTNRTFKSDDRLLAPDTVERIISVCNGNHYNFTKRQNIANRKKYYRLEKKCIGPGALIKQTACNDLNVSVEKPQPENNENSLKVIEEHHQQQKSATIQSDIIHQCDITTETIRNCVTKKNNSDRQIEKNDVVKKKKKVTKRQNNHCCWAREKMLFWQNKTQRVRRHMCPRIKCICCCNILYTDQLLRRRQKQSVNVTSFCDLVSDDESDHNAKNLHEPRKPLKTTKESPEKITKNIGKNYSKIINKVDIGVNTDFDKDFEERYAANVNNSSVVNSLHVIQAVISDVSLNNKGHSNNSTQTFTYTKNNFDSAPHNALTSDIRIREKSHLNNEVESCAKNYTPELQLENATTSKDKPINNGPKCKTNVRAATNHQPVAPVVSCIDIDNLPTDNGGKVIVLHKNSKAKSSKPICLGKNKILLCSLHPLSKTSMIDVTHLVETVKPLMFSYGVNADVQTLIPSGVHLVLLPNQELVLSIDPGVELSPNQINYLPTILNLVQQQLFNLGAINKLPKAYTIGDIIHLSDDETGNYTSQDESYDDNTNLKKKEEIRPSNNLKSSNPENDISFIEEAVSCADKHPSDDSSSNMASSETLSVSLIKEFVNNNKNIPKIDASSTESSKEDKQQHTLSNDSNVLIEKDVVSDDSKKEDLKDTANMPKKTIISDLMAMSGISLEDTAVTNIENSINQIPPQPKPIPILPKPSKEPDNLYTNKDDEMNNKIYNNPFVKAALTKCPELFIVYSFEDLKYAYENNGQFYKMNIDNGIIVPISVSIKKQMTTKNLKQVKSVIDLTGEDNNDTSGAETRSEESSIQTFIERDLLKSGVKPIKLFKSIHPSILRHNFKTLSMRRYSGDSKKQTKKVTKAVKSKRKNEINIIDLKSRQSKKLVQEVDKINIDSESDDEPLALKAKRIRRTSVNISENIDNAKSHNENCQREVQALNQQEHNCDEATSHSVPILVEDHVSSHLPIIFQSNNDESSGEDCILGV
ncbi:uncharacterized protein LOC126777338 [Nymphalis io]|uniref:uncharacterized protein LOC126777338 n=1 Tax=Inachis io TaxID=171585 RepID=UPI002167B279|nr:uncharacterized protein LOC126777338 [Nymphalis io]